MPTPLDAIPPGVLDGLTELEATNRLEHLLAGQRAAFLDDAPPAAAVRRNRIDRLVAVLTEHADEISAALTADFGSRPDVVNQLSDIGGILPDILTTRARLGRWMRPDRVRGLGLAGMRTTVDKKPLGVVGVIGPWNFPVGLLVQPAAAAFAAGNRVMAKVSDVTPAVGAVLARRISEYFDPSEMVVVTGGLEVATAFSRLQLDHLFFTGSPGVGAIVAQAAGRNLVPVTLELGGKNPAVVAPTANVEKAAGRILAARLANGGQLCLCPDEAFVPRAQVDDFVDAALAEASRIAPTIIGNDQLVSIVNDRNYARITGLIEDAAAKGAGVHQSVPVGEVLPDPVGRRIPPTLLTGVTDEMEIANEEVFGPVLTVRAYDSIADVVQRVASRPAPLAAYWFGPDGADLDHFRERTTSGGMTINDFAAHCAVPGVPFGGVGHSGSGAYHGKAGFDTFTHRRTVVQSRLPLSFGRLMAPPYSRRFRSGLNTSIRLVRRVTARRLKRHDRSSS